jgi:hypothetical protein
MEVERFKHRQLAPTVGAIVTIIRRIQRTLSSNSIYSSAWLLRQPISDSALNCMSRSNSADSIPYSRIGPNRVHMPAEISKLDSGSTHQDRGRIHINFFPSRSPSRLIQKQGAWDRAVFEFEAKFVYCCTTSRGTLTSYFSQQALTCTGSVKNRASNPCGLCAAANSICCILLYMHESIPASY